MADTTLDPVRRDLALKARQQLALDCAQEVIDQLQKVFAVASGGVAFANLNHNTTEATIFSCIEDMVTSTESLMSLREHINEMAALAEANSVTEVAHR